MDRELIDVWDVPSLPEERRRELGRLAFQILDRPHIHGDTAVSWALEMSVSNIIPDDVTEPIESLAWIGKPQDQSGLIASDSIRSQYEGPAKKRWNAIALFGYIPAI